MLTGNGRHWLYTPICLLRVTADHTASETELAHFIMIVMMMMSVMTIVTAMNKDFPLNRGDCEIYLSYLSKWPTAANLFLLQLRPTAHVYIIPWSELWCRTPCIGPFSAISPPILLSLFADLHCRPIYVSLKGRTTFFRKVEFSSISECKILFHVITKRSVVFLSFLQHAQAPHWGEHLLTSSGLQAANSGLNKATHYQVLPSKVPWSLFCLLDRLPVTFLRLQSFLCYLNPKYFTFLTVPHPATT